MKIKIALFGFALFFSLFPSAFADDLNLFVSIQPQKTFVEKIGGDKVKVSVMVEPGASPATYEPKPRQMAALSKATLYFAVGVPFENAWLDKIVAANPSMRIVRTQEWIEKMPMAAHHHHNDEESPEDAEHGHHKEHGHHEADHGKSHGDEKELHHDDAEHSGGDHAAEGHDHGIRDPHIWLSPPLVMLQARHIAMALSQADPENRSVYMKNYGNFAAEVAALDAELGNLFANVPPKSGFMVFHPAWGYFAEAYGLTQIPIEIEGKEPKPSELKGLIERAKAEKIRVIFVQPQFSQKSARMIAQSIEGSVVTADPLSPDWAENLKDVARKIRDTLQ